MRSSLQKHFASKISGCCTNANKFSVFDVCFLAIFSSAILAAATYNLAAFNPQSSILVKRQRIHSTSSLFPGMKNLIIDDDSDSSDNDESESSDSDEEYLPNEASPQLEHDMLAEFWEKIDDLDSVSKCHEAYEFGMQLIGNFISDFSADKNALIELLQRGNVSSAHYEQDYRQLQVCLSLHMIQFLKFDTCFWILLDDIAFDLSLQDTSAVDFRARELLSEIRMYEQQIDARIAEANFGGNMLNESANSTVTANPELNE